MRGDPVYRVVIRVFQGVFRLLGLRFTLSGLENVPAEGPAVLACNHLSYLDFTFVEFAAKRRRRLVRFMAKQSVFDNAVSGPLMRAMRHIPVDRTSGAAAYRRAARALEAGEAVGIFPEATISRSWELTSFKLGAATLAVRERVPLVPVVLWGAQRTFTTDKRYSVGRGKAICVCIGPPIVAGPTDSPADIDLELRRRMQVLLESARSTYPDAPSSADDRWWLPASCGGTAPTPERAAELEASATARRARRVGQPALRRWRGARRGR